MPRFKPPAQRILLALGAGLFALTIWMAVAFGQPAGGADLSVEANCQPAALGAVALGALGLELAGQAEEDRGFVVERWVAPPGQAPGWATVLLLPDGQGGLSRCLLLHRLPDLGAPS